MSEREVTATEALLLLTVRICPLVMDGMRVRMMRRMRGAARDEPPHEDGPR